MDLFVATDFETQSEEIAGEITQPSQADLVLGIDSQTAI
jgi:hypothetical protein